MCNGKIDQVVLGKRTLRNTEKTSKSGVMKSVKFSAPEKPEAASLPATHIPPVPAYYVLPGEYELIEMNSIHFSFNSAA